MEDNSRGKGKRTRSRRASAFYGLGSIASTPDGLLTVQPMYLELSEDSANWKTSWVCLSNNYLLLMDSESDPEAGADTIDMRRVESVETSVLEGGEKAICVREVGRLVYLRMHSQYELGIWTRALRQRQSFSFEVAVPSAPQSVLGAGPAPGPPPGPPALGTPSIPPKQEPQRRRSTAMDLLRKLATADRENAQLNADASAAHEEASAKFAAVTREMEELRAQYAAVREQSTGLDESVSTAVKRAQIAEERSERLASDLHEARRTAEHAQSAVTELNQELERERSAMRSAVEHAHRQQGLAESSSPRAPSFAAAAAQDATTPRTTHRQKRSSQMRQALAAFRRADRDSSGFVDAVELLATLPEGKTCEDAQRLITKFGEDGATTLNRSRYIRMQKSVWEEEDRQREAAAAAADAAAHEPSVASDDGDDEVENGAYDSDGGDDRRGVIAELRGELAAYEKARLELESAFEAEEIATLEQRQRADGFERRAHWLAEQLAAAEEERRAMGAKLLDGIVEAHAAEGTRDAAAQDSARALAELRGEWAQLTRSSAQLEAQLNASRERDAEARRELKRRVTLALIADHEASLRAKAGGKREEAAKAEAAAAVTEAAVLRSELAEKRNDIAEAERSAKQRADGDADERVASVRVLVRALEARIGGADALNARLSTDLEAMASDAAAMRATITSMTTRLNAEARAREGEEVTRAVQRAAEVESDAALRRTATSEALAAAHAEVRSLLKRLAEADSTTDARVRDAAARERAARADFDHARGLREEMQKLRIGEGERIERARSVAVEAEKRRSGFVVDGMRAEIRALRARVVAGTGNGVVAMMPGKTRHIHIDRTGTVTLAS